MYFCLRGKWALHLVIHLEIQLSEREHSLIHWLSHDLGVRMLTRLAPNFPAYFEAKPRCICCVCKFICTYDLNTYTQ